MGSEILQALPTDEAVLRSRILEVLKKNDVYRDVEDVTLRIPEELKGQHFATESVYVQLNFKESKVKNCFLKIYAANPVHRQMMKSLQMMEKEASFYNEFLPFARKFTATRGCENMLDFFPQCVYADEEMVLLENLVLDDNYKMLSMEELQEIDTAKLALSNVAKLHAVTYGMIQDVGLEQFTQKWALNISETTTKNQFLESMVLNGPRNCLKILRGHAIAGSKDEVQFLSEYVKIAPGRIGKLLEDAANAKFVTLGHGDFWNNNMLFKMASGNGEAMKNVLLDFQITRLASPVIDISYFLFTSVKADIRQENIQDLLHYYFNEFKQNVELLNISCPITFQEFVKEYKEFCEYGFLMGLFFLSMSGCVKALDFDVMGTGEEEDGMKAFSKAVSEWIEQNPEVAKSFTIKIIRLIQEYKDIKFN